MNAGLIKGTGPLHFRSRNKLDPFGSGFGPVGHRHPRRDPESEEHKGPDGKTETAEEKTARESAEAAAKEKDKAKTAEQKAAEKAARDALAAKEAAEKELEDLRAKHATDEEKKVAEQVKEGLAAAISAKETELTDRFSTQILELQNDLIDTTLDAAFEKVGKSRASYATVLATLDRRVFVGDDGKVKKEEVTKWASELAGSASSRPPRTGGLGSGSGRKDRGFGHLINQN